MKAWYVLRRILTHRRRMLCDSILCAEQTHRRSTCARCSTQAARCCTSDGCVVIVTGFAAVLMSVGVALLCGCRSKMKRGATCPGEERVSRIWTRQCEPGEMWSCEEQGVVVHDTVNGVAAYDVVTGEEKWSIENGRVLGWTFRRQKCIVAFDNDTHVRQRAITVDTVMGSREAIAMPQVELRWVREVEKGIFIGIEQSRIRRWRSDETGIHELNVIDLPGSGESYMELVSPPNLTIVATSSVRAVVSPWIGRAAWVDFEKGIAKLIDRPFFVEFLWQCDSFSASAYSQCPYAEPCVISGECGQLNRIRIYRIDGATGMVEEWGSVVTNQVVTKMAIVQDRYIVMTTDRPVSGRPGRYVREFVIVDNEQKEVVGRLVDREEKWWNYVSLLGIARQPIFIRYIGYRMEAWKIAN